ncbi:MAG: hypothetical protein ACRD0A_01610 [Acidimicrobiales bacterium]
MSVGAGCGESGGTEAPSSGRPPASDEPRDGEIRATIDAVWAAVGVGRDDPYVGAYVYTFEPDNTACADLAREDRWFGARGSSVAPGLVDQQTAESAITGLLEGEGFTVERYRSTHPASVVRTYRAVRGELVVFGFLNGDGATDVNVRSGPCAPGFTRFDPDLYQPDA